MKCKICQGVKCKVNTRLHKNLPVLHWLQPGDTSHVINEDDFLKAVIEEETEKDCFTTVVINGINPTHIPYLKTYMTQWTRQLA